MKQATPRMTSAKEISQVLAMVFHSRKSTDSDKASSMAVEIERKFLVKGTFPAGETCQMVQGYLSLDPERTVRIRIEEDKGVLAIKGRSQGISRAEYEYDVPLAEAEELLKLCLGSLVRKTRHYIPHGDHTWEVDVFQGDNEGLVSAEIELSAEDESFELPEWIGQEVSEDRRYSNAALSRSPFKDWA
ncbi:CYTH domain-containing protein [Rubritalea squalenifaciens DSM 18772]|uniref:CYTH domain-containing protein n=2 Tax=Rubritalea squalenifaciens TaxID=407226 RepID=A0A1M6BDB0_9BACT|nr:CYTH domain-containing protein [Rubritalea squalenifaciens]SHI46705.1 CYTH domain-containing protein [Rubritalea squalenifaciens DSM 18772]